MRRYWIAAVLLALAVNVAGFTQHCGLWPDSIGFFQEPGLREGLSRMMDPDDWDLLCGGRLTWDLREAVLEWKLATSESYGKSTGLLLNPAVDQYSDPFFADHRLNPFGIPEVREGIFHLIDREFVADDIFSGGARPRWAILDPAVPPHPDSIESVRVPKRVYRYDPYTAMELIDESLSEWAERDRWSGNWSDNYSGEPVAVVGLVPEEGVARWVGVYVADLLEEAGFAVELRYCSSAELASMALSSDPYEGEWSFCITQGERPAVGDDQLSDYEALYTFRGEPLWPWYMHPEAEDVFWRVPGRELLSASERVELLESAEACAQELAWHEWLCTEEVIDAWSQDINLAVDSIEGFAGSHLWGQTVRFVDEDGESLVGGTIRVACSDLLAEPWNPIDGSRAASDMMIQRATEDWFLYRDPNSGRFVPHLVAYAECIVTEDIPMTSDHEEFYVEAVEEIDVPGDAWVDWDASSQRFITAWEAFPDGLTARTKTVCRFVDDLFENTWHDGSCFSIGDMLMRFIMTFDVANPDSPIYDESQVASFEQFIEGFRGARITSTDPLTIEVYDDRFCLDAGAQVFERIGLFWPYYGSGMAPWPTMAIAWRAAAEGLRIGCQDWIDWRSPSFSDLVLNAERAQQEGLPPYPETLLGWIDEAEVRERYENTQGFLKSYGHLWIGNGPMMIDEIDAEDRIVVGERFDGYRHDMSEWLELPAAKVGNMEICDPGAVSVGGEAAFSIALTFEDGPRAEAYPADEIDGIKYFLFDEAGELVLSGVGEVYGDGALGVTLSEGETETLVPGLWEIEAVAVLRSVAVPSVGSIWFDVQPD